MVRRRVEIKPIQDKSKRHTTFTKRRSGLFKKAEELCGLCGGAAAVITFSKAGNVFGFGHPSVEHVVSRYLADPNSTLVTEDEDSHVETCLHASGGGTEKKEVKAPPLTETETRIAEALANHRPAWDVMVRNLALSELHELEASVREIKSTVEARAAEAEAEAAGI
ncbi:agamous-like MADS-box protein AGL62 [Sesamum indicum]|uniref:Agamous-like MADS-box protein AGL62 n=1 Tax=Sesamum indicum TaxID=4182 RepID=A0A6I9UKP8_SESIN|nr:agamous-like MADS-box protein AGL62 [Sesamum indicum]